MLFLLFGFGSRIRRLGNGGERTCPRCHNQATWIRARSYSQFTVFFIPVARWNRREFEACPICGEQTDLHDTHRHRRPLHTAGAA